MHRNRVRALALVTSAVTAVTLTALTVTATSASAGDFPVPTLQEFASSSFQDEDLTYIVNGDEPAYNVGDLRVLYDQMTGAERYAVHHAPTDGLIVNTVRGVDDKWTASQALNLTYCVSTKFGTNHAKVVTAMATGTGLWEAASTKVNFTYVPSQDGACTTRNSSIVFSVEPTTTTQYIARAFFPSTSKRGRNILVNATSLYNSGSWTPGNIMGHELGHVLGFRHEHTRPEAGTCFEDNNWRPLTPYDSASIMHYPQCNGTSADLSMTDQDRAGIRALYGS